MRRVPPVLAPFCRRELHCDGARRPGRSGAHLGSNERLHHMITIIKSGTIVTAEQTYQADILIEDEKIKDIARDLPSQNADKIIDAQGMYVLPGGIDTHTHLDMPFGGTTSSDD